MSAPAIEQVHGGINPHMRIRYTLSRSICSLCERRDISHQAWGKRKYIEFAARQIYRVRHWRTYRQSTFISSKNTKPRASNLSSTIIKRRKSTSSLVSERVQIALRAFCEKQNRVRSTTSVDVKLASSICFNKCGGSIFKELSRLIDFSGDL